MNVKICVTNSTHIVYAQEICKLIEDAAIQRGTGIAKRSPDYIKEKIRNEQSIISLYNKEVVGFCYIESWEHKRFVANSGLIVREDFRKTGLAREIKQRAFELSRELYPQAKIFGITTSLPVMKINSDLGYKPVPFSELTQDEKFWQGCQGCINYDILQRTQRKHCLCTGMLYNPNSLPLPGEATKISRWEKFQQFLRIGKSKGGASKNYKSIFSKNE